MKSFKQNTIWQSTDQHGISLIESKQFTTKGREGCALHLTAIKRTDQARHRVVFAVEPSLTLSSPSPPPPSPPSPSLISDLASVDVKQNVLEASDRHYRVPGEIMRREVELDPQVIPEKIMRWSWAAKDFLRFGLFFNSSATDIVLVTLPSGSWNSNCVVH